MIYRDNYSIEIRNHEVGPFFALDLWKINKATVDQLKEDCDLLKNKLLELGEDMLFAETRNPKIVRLSKRTMGEAFDIQEPEPGLWVISWDLEED